MQTYEGYRQLLRRAVTGKRGGRAGEQLGDGGEQDRKGWLKLVNLYQNDDLTPVASRVLVAQTFSERLCGLMFTPELARQDGLILPGCSMVQMCFMRYPIDILFLSRDQVVLRVVRALRPWRVSPYVRGAFFAVELAAGVATERQIHVGDRVWWRAD